MEQIVSKSPLWTRS